MPKIVIDKKVLFALASETRIEILKNLSERRMTLTELSERLKMSKTTIKEHLNRLIEAGLVERVNEGRKWIYYELTEKGRKILYPDDLTKIVLLLSSAIASVITGLCELYISSRKQIITPTPIPAPTPPPHRLPSIHIPLGLALIGIGVGLLCSVQKGKIIEVRQPLIHHYFSAQGASSSHHGYLRKV